MQQRTANPYWRLTAKELEGYRSLNRDQIREEREHRARIAEETLRAENYQVSPGEIDQADDSVRQRRLVMLGSTAQAPRDKGQKPISYQNSEQTGRFRSTIAADRN
jgi:hypothetical protein